MSALTWQQGSPSAPDTPARSRGFAWRHAVGLLALVALAAGAWSLTVAVERGALLPLETVRFNGELRHLDRAELRAAVSPHLDDSWLRADVAAVRDALEALPWVQSAAIRRVWPDTLRLTITEHEPFAQWGETGVISDNGAVYRPDQRPSGLPVLAGPEGTAQRVVATYQQLQTLLPAIGWELAGLTLDERQSWRARLASGARIVIGREEWRQRVERLVAAWPQLDQRDRTLERVDLRYPNGFAVRWSTGGRAEMQSPKGRTDES
jgi:cell division protein FtsQ